MQKLDLFLVASSFLAFPLLGQAQQNTSCFVKHLQFLGNFLRETVIYNGWWINIINEIFIL